jgi:hypothetical protein
MLICSTQTALSLTFAHKVSDNEGCYQPVSGYEGCPGGTGDLLY